MAIQGPGKERARGADRAYHGTVLGLMGRGLLGFEVWARLWLVLVLCRLCVACLSGVAWLCNCVLFEVVNVCIGRYRYSTAKPSYYTKSIGLRLEMYR